MNDKSGFSFGTIVNPPGGFKKLPDHVAFDLCRAYPLPDEKLLLHNARNGKRAMVRPTVYSSLLLCRQFRTIDEHAAYIVECNPGMQGQQADIARVLQTMVASGMLVSAREICDSLKQRREEPADTDPPGDPVVAIITWERPQALERLLSSISNNCDTENMHCLYVIDDSRTAENIRQNRALSEKFAPEIGTPLKYFGRQEQTSLLEQLGKKLPGQRQTIDFLADHSRWPDHWTAGLSRNLALLLSCGRRLVVMDDDSVCDVFDPPRPKPAITFSDAPREADFFASEQDWIPLHQQINPDPIQRHMQFLGLSFSEALAVLGENNLKPTTFTDSTALQISELQQDSPVLVTECGSLGCPGTAANTWLPDMAPNSLKQMLASSEKTTQALTIRQVWSGRNQPHFAPRPNMSQITGFDNRRFLPPYLPIMRNQDKLFGLMLDFIFPSSVTLDLPWAVPHLPIPERSWSDRELNFTPGDSFPAFFFEKILEHKSTCLSDSPEARLEALSAWFDDLAAASKHVLRDMYREARLRNDAETLRHLDELLTRSDTAPVDWQNYLRNGIGQLNADIELASRADFPVRGLPRGMEGDELITFWKEVWSGFARALSAWPEIRNAAAEIIEAQSPSSK